MKWRTRRATEEITADGLCDWLKILCQGCAKNVIRKAIARAGETIEAFFHKRCVKDLLRKKHPKSILNRPKACPEALEPWKAPTKESSCIGFDFFARLGLDHIMISTILRYNKSQTLYSTNCQKTLKPPKTTFGGVLRFLVFCALGFNWFWIPTWLPGDYCFGKTTILPNSYSHFSGKSTQKAMPNDNGAKIRRKSHRTPSPDTLVRSGGDFD